MFLDPPPTLSFNSGISMSLETSTCDRKNDENSMSLDTLVQTVVTMPLQAPPFTHNPDLEECAAWMLVV